MPPAANRRCNTEIFKWQQPERLPPKNPRPAGATDPAAPKSGAAPPERSAARPRSRTGSHPGRPRRRRRRPRKSFRSSTRSRRPSAIAPPRARRAGLPPISMKQLKPITRRHSQCRRPGTSRRRAGTRAAAGPSRSRRAPEAPPQPAAEEDDACRREDHPHQAAHHHQGACGPAWAAPPQIMKDLMEMNIFANINQSIEADVAGAHLQEARFYL